MIEAMLNSAYNISLPIDKDIIFGFSINLFYEGGHLVDRRKDGNKLLNNYYKTFPDALNYYHPRDARRHRKIDQVDPLAYYDSLAEKLDSSETFGAGLYGFPDGRGVGKATPFYIGNVGSSHFQLWSDVSAYFPVNWVAANGFDAFISKVLHWCDLLGPGHGTAGPSFIPDVGGGVGRASQLAFPLIKRFPGLDFPDTGIWKAEVRAEKTRWIRTTNWLTILDDTFVKMLGGEGALTKNLGEDCTIHRWNKGVVIQAGEEPQIGDINTGDIPLAYKKVATATKILRFENFKPGYGILHPPSPLDGAEESLKWIRRFD